MQSSLCTTCSISLLPWWDIIYFFIMSAFANENMVVHCALGVAIHGDFKEKRNFNPLIVSY